jgi:hypothetical protein
MNHPDLLPGESTKTVGVVPPGALEARPRLWRALEQAFPVIFVARERGALDGLDGAVVEGEDLAAGAGISVLQTCSQETAHGEARIRMSAAAELPGCLRERELADARARALPALHPRSGETVLASREGAPMWVADASAGTHRCSALPAELDEGEPLRARLTAGRFLALLPLLTLLRSLTEGTRWAPPPPRAAFIIDDPNLHWPSYGYLDFADLAARARRARFHLACATVPLDAWYASRRAVALFRRPELSLLFHGNDHAWCELGRARTQELALAIVAQALGRMEALERRTGVAVARVMAPPHGECSQAVFHALRRTGFLAACISRPYPWLEKPPADRPLAQWEIADMVDGLPVLPRCSLTRSPEDIPLRSLLGQPLILYGHHRDLASGPERLEEIAREVNRLGNVRWGDLASIARSSFLTRRDGETLRVRLYTREAEVEVPEGVRYLAVEAPADTAHRAGVSAQLTSAAGASRAPLGAPVELDGDGPLRVSLLGDDGVDAAAVRAPRWRPWPRTRRLLVEGRDRLAPHLDGARRRVPGARAGAIRGDAPTLTLGQTGFGDCSRSSESA